MLNPVVERSCLCGASAGAVTWTDAGARSRRRLGQHPLALDDRAARRGQGGAEHRRRGIILRRRRDARGRPRDAAADDAAAVELNVGIVDRCP